MKKTLITILILGIASVAGAGLTWSQNAITVIGGDPVTVYLVGALEDASYSVDATAIPVSSITITPLPAAGSLASVYQYPAGHAWEGYIWLQVAGNTPPYVPSDNLFQVDIDTTGFADRDYILYADIWGINDQLTLTVVPEPITISLLAIGGLFLRYKKSI